MMAKNDKRNRKASQSPPLAGQQVSSQGKKEDQVAILKGVEEGATVVTSGQLKLKNGTPLIINNKVEPANSPNPKPQE